MIEALWSVEFDTNVDGGGTGIAVFETGRVFGGDSMMIYVGSYNVENGTLNAVINVEKYSNTPGMASVVGLNKFSLVLSGKPDPQQMHLSGHVAGSPEKRMVVRAVRRAELP